ncbi:Serine/threonine protein kinase [Noviherbaspirillum humi]|uniref:Serine/threonine protein kinase n=1 Tax=Noviherbaspirillum humi TaxID=1688639 RepID=A0A239M9V4_9BURK|nr:protein kinase [Noviherbaspirillum humi]SNT38774.1 Serine/threonine protein kinase [Noviherbaspirillum humi]
MNPQTDKTAMRTLGIQTREPAAAERECSANTLSPGTRLNEFEIIDLIGEGGFGIVYLAYDHSLGRHVALKEYMPSGLASRTGSMAVTVRSAQNEATFTAGLKSFINEARLLAQFDAPALVKVHRFWEGNGTAYMVMPYYEGTTLKQAVKSRRITPNESWIRLLLTDLCDAIAVIHRAQCLHRDIAPDNIMLLNDGRPLLLDFGAARKVIGDFTHCLTVILKPGFAPIEQYADIAGLRQGPWTDIYALAAVVYFLIGGHAPPPAVARMVRDEMKSAAEIGKGRFSSGFLAVIDKALAVKPEKRFQSIGEFRHALGLAETPPREMPRAEAPTRTAAPAPEPAQEDVTMKAPPADDLPPMQGEFRNPPGTPRRAAAVPADSMWNRPLPTWVTLGLVLAAGVASGVYWGNQNQRALPRPAAMQSSGNSEAGTSAGGGPEAAKPETPMQAEAGTPSASRKTARPTEPAQPQRSEAVPPPAAAASAPAPRASDAPPAVPAAYAEDESWRRAANSGQPYFYESYLRQYPRGRYAQAARQWLESRKAKPAAEAVAAAPGPAARQPEVRMEPRQRPAQESASAKPDAAEPSPAQIEERAWDTAVAINQAPAFEAYLNRYPRGRFAALARDRIAGLKPPAASAAVPAEPAQEARASAPEQPAANAAAKPAEPASTTAAASNAPPATSGSSGTASSRSSASGGIPTVTERKTLKVGNQTMIGDFSADPKTGSVSGTGRIVWSDGNQFDGTLVQGKKEGRGQFVWQNGQRYNGEWAHDMPNGRGTIVYANGDRYQGEVRDGLPHGKGTFWFKSGDRYQGDWVRGKNHGQGRYTWANGSYWEGEFRDDRRTDNGNLVSAEHAAASADRKER